MLKVAVLDDYQNIFSQIVNLDEYKSKYEFTIFNEPFQNELETIEALKDFEAIFIMRERTKIRMETLRRRSSRRRSRTRTFSS